MTADAVGLNDRFVTSLRQLGLIATSDVEAAFRAVRRDRFLPHVPLRDVYRDTCIVTKRAGARDLSSASQPALVAAMLAQLDLRPGHRVLEIGAGTGYNAALMAHLVGPAGRVQTIDIEPDVAARAALHLRSAGVRNVKVLAADGGLGCEADAPYDRIVLTVAAADITTAWRDQLAEGGRLLVPLSVRGPQKSIAFVRRGEHLESVSVEDCHFILLRGQFDAGAELTAMQCGPLEIVSDGVCQRDLDDASLATARPEEIRTGIVSGAAEVGGTISCRLALQFRGFCRVSAASQAAQTAWFGGSSRVAAGRTVGVFENGTLCVLLGPVAPGRSLSDSPFELYLRTVGPDRALAGRVLEAVRCWVAAGRPGNAALTVHARPRHLDTDATGPWVLRRPCHTYVFDWTSYKVPVALASPQRSTS
jgi:protein-L-isoaspartate(D-aspartate) O-methyltransferase